MSVRGSILKAIAKQQGAPRAAAEPASNVVPFPGTKKARARKAKKPKRYKRISDQGAHPGAFQGKSGKYTDSFVKEIIGGKTYMRRRDGALFTLQRDGSWKLVAEPRAQRKGRGLALPLGVAAAGAGGAGAIGYMEGRRRK